MEHHYKLKKEEHIELTKLLKLTNICQSGGEAKHVVDQGVVRRNGEVEMRKRCKLVKGDIIEFLNNKIYVQ